MLFCRLVIKNKVKERGGSAPLLDCCVESLDCMFPAFPFWEIVCQSAGRDVFFLLCNFFLDGEFTTVVAASGAYGVVDVPCAAVRADCQCGGYCLIVGSAFESTGL